jgi:hypothetical protein
MSSSYCGNYTNGQDGGSCYDQSGGYGQQQQQDQQQQQQQQGIFHGWIRPRKDNQQWQLNQYAAAAKRLTWTISRTQRNGSFGANQVSPAPNFWNPAQQLVTALAWIHGEHF